MNESYQNKPKPQNPGNNPNATFSSTSAKPAAQKPAANERTSLLATKTDTNTVEQIPDKPWWKLW